jgi:glycosyltransferase involved in cell wall biosynthesis
MTAFKKKIIITSNSFWNLYNFRKSLILELKKKFIIILVAPNDKYRNFFEKKKITTKLIKFNRRDINLFSFFFYILNFLKLVLKEKPDLLLLYTIKPNLAGSIISLICRIKCINVITGLGSGFLNNVILKNFIIFIYKLTINFSSLVIFQNKEDKHFFKKKILNSNVGTTIIPGSGVNYKKKNKKKKFNKNVKFIYTGRIIKDKGVIELFEVIKNIKKKYKNIIFLIVGDIDNNNLSPISFKTLNFMKNNKLIIHKKFSDNIHKYLKRSDCLILPSYREGSSKSLLEGASYGLPLIASNVPGCSNIVKNNYNGYLVKAKSALSLEKAIYKFIFLSKKKKMLMSKNSIKIIKNNFLEKKINYLFIKKIKEIIQ